MKILKLFVCFAAFVYCFSSLIGAGLRGHFLWFVYWAILIYLLGEFLILLAKDIDEDRQRPK